MWVVPITGSPPMPTAVEKPMSRSSYIIWYVSVPDLETRPIRPAVVMSAGMMPALDLPGEATPGQFGPMILVTLPAALARAQNCAVSCTGMPSVMPWIMTRLWPVRKMAISGSLRCKFGGPAGRAVHRRYLLDHADGRLVKDPPGLGGVVPV